MNSYGNRVTLTIFGQSHSQAIGAVLDHLPAGKTLNMERIQAMMARRSSQGKAYATARAEADEVQIISGLFQGKTCGAPLCAVIANGDTKSKDYSQFQTVPRPSHADYGAMVKYHGFADYRGGGPYSGRLTAPLVFAGAVLEQFLEELGVHIFARIQQIGTIKDVPLNLHQLTPQQLQGMDQNFPTIGDSAQMLNAIQTAQSQGDSLGGVVECVIFGVPVGTGEPMFQGLENAIAQAVFAVPAVKGIEFGSGFALAEMSGSQANDAYCIKNNAVHTQTNHNGGILGGMATGEPIVFRVAIKPTPSIYQKQQSINVATKEEIELQIQGRHDPCIVPRAAVAVESAAALAVSQFLL